MERKRINKNLRCTHFISRLYITFMQNSDPRLARRGVSAGSVEVKRLDTIIDRTPQELKKTDRRFSSDSQRTLESFRHVDPSRHTRDRFYPLGHYMGDAYRGVYTCRNVLTHHFDLVYLRDVSPRRRSDCLAHIRPAIFPLDVVDSQAAVAIQGDSFGRLLLLPEAAFGQKNLIPPPSHPSLRVYMSRNNYLFPYT